MEEQARPHRPPITRHPIHRAGGPVPLAVLFIIAGVALPLLALASLVGGE